MTVTDLKRENTEAVLSAICGSDGISRSEIAQRTGLSLMTVGKAAHRLISLGIIREHMPKYSGKGRVAGVLSVSRETLCFVCDISSDPFVAYTVDIGGRTVGRLRYDYDFGSTPEENLADFLSDARSLLAHCRWVMGSALVYSGRYIPEIGELIMPFTKTGLSAYPLRAMEQILGFRPDIISHALSVAEAGMAGCADLNGFCLAFDVGFDVSGRIIYNVDGLRGERELDLSSLTCGGVLLSEAVKTARNVWELAEILKCAIGPLSRILMPCGIFIWLKLWEGNESARRTLADGIGCPVTLSDDPRIADIERIARLFSEKWINAELFRT